MVSSRILLKDTFFPDFPWAHKNKSPILDKWKVPFYPKAVKGGHTYLEHYHEPDVLWAHSFFRHF